MTFLEDFQSSLESLPVLLQRHYSVMRDLDDSLLVLQRQNEQRCEQEIEEIKNGIQCGSIKSDSQRTRFSNEALDEQKHCIQISDEKVALALTAYDLVDRQIQQLDEYLKKCEVIRREGEIAAATREASLNAEANNTNLKTGRGLRKKYRTRLAEAADVATLHSLGLQLDLPVDPNEPTYCLCNQVSYGEMVACDNPACKIEWFHFGCVGLEEQPKGLWFCSDCASTKKRRKCK